jgi:PIN domain nuclease of toxin-antitoxin system
VILLLDSHALLWWLADNGELSADARAAIADPENEALVSAAVVWEIEIKRALGKLQSPDDLIDVLEPSGFGSLPITLDDATTAARLPHHHRDPFDRMIVAQAQRLDAVIISRDPVFATYNAPAIIA